MSDFQLYSFFLCLIVFFLLTLISTVMMTALVKLSVRLIEVGAEDEELKREHLLSGNRRLKEARGRGISIAVSLLMSLVFLTALVTSIYIHVTDEAFSDSFPTPKVVQSTSMAEKYEKNTYLTENKLDDQFDIHDIVLTYALPPEEELKLYDIVVYERDDMMIIHRIIGIEEPNAEHPDCRHFLLRGDAVKSSDYFPVLYSQMRGIYRGEHIPYVGSFVTFMQSPAGWLCVALLVAATLLSPVLDAYFRRVKRRRLAVLGIVRQEAVNK